MCGLLNDLLTGQMIKGVLRQKAPLIWKRDLDGSTVQITESQPMQLDVAPDYGSLIRASRHTGTHLQIAMG
jgi:hypothetical protein